MSTAKQHENARNYRPSKAEAREALFPISYPSPAEAPVAGVLFFVITVATSFAILNLVLPPDPSLAVALFASLGVAIACFTVIILAFMLTAEAVLTGFEPALTARFQDEVEAAVQKALEANAQDTKQRPGRLWGQLKK